LAFISVPGLPDGIFSTQKIPIWVNFGCSCNGRCLSILWQFGLFYDNLVYFMDIWCILWLYDIFFSFGYVLPRKIWQPCSVHVHTQLVKSLVVTACLVALDFM
jgi:hypothetical protein